MTFLLVLKCLLCGKLYFGTSLRQGSETRSKNGSDHTCKNKKQKTERLSNSVCLLVLSYVNKYVLNKFNDTHIYFLFMSHECVQ